MGVMRSPGALHILLQGGKGALRSGKIARLQSALKGLKICANLVGLAGRVAGYSRRQGGVLHVLLYGCKGLLGAGNVARLEGGLKGLEVLSALFEAALNSRLVWGHSRVYA